MEQEGSAQFIGMLVSAVALLFMFAGLSKLFYLREFRASLLFVPYLPMTIVPPLVVVVPILELAAGASLLVGMPLRVLLPCVILVSTSLVAVVASIRKQPIPCVCFTASGTESLSLATAARNLILTAVALSPLMAPVALVDTEPFVPVYGV